MIPSLPQDDDKPDARRSQLSQAQGLYRYDYEAYPPLALAAEVPQAEEVSEAWKLITLQRTLKLAINSAKADEREYGAELTLGGALFSLLLADHQGGLKRVLQEVNDLVKTGQSRGRPRSLADYSRLFAEIDLPEVAHDYREDSSFAEQRLSGANPMWIQRVAAPPANFPLSEAHYLAALGALAPGDSLAAAGAEGRLYLADYKVLDGAACGTFPAAQKFLCAPLALFAVPPHGAPDRVFAPVAIQLGQSAGSPILTPQDGQAWLEAKTRVQTADGNCHQAICHLGRTHMPLEAFVLATHRQLSARHPLHVLLAPHFEGTLAINESANTTLLAPGGGVDTVLAGTIETSRALAAQAAASWHLEQARLPDDLAARGVDDTQALPHYPYRDDGLLVWGAIEAWVEAYTSVYYPSDAQVRADFELQAWGAELVSREGGRIQGFGEGTPGRLETRAYLVSALTTVIFTASAQHAAVNFPQFTSMAFVPNWPLASYTPADAPTTPQSYLDLLPPLDVAHMQTSLGYLLGTVYYTQLGRYGTLFKRYFADQRIRPAEDAFRARLSQVEATIEERNRGRKAPYPHLLPSKIPQSINI